jgi:16S rRNA (guanine527-N7)-methyltransferase
MSGAAHEHAWRQFALDGAQRDKLAQLVALLARDEHAPTAIREPQQVAEQHVADSLTALDFGPVRDARAVVDLGSGAGFPGVALAVALPAAQVVLLESQRRKCDFLERMREQAALANVRVVCERAEAWSEGAGRFDVALARALAPQPVVLEYAAPLLAVGGVLVDWRGRRDEREEEVAQRAAEELGLERLAIERSEPFAGARDRHLHLFAKRAPTPPRFPRRPGAARKRPLG